MSNEQTRCGESLPMPANAVRVVPQDLWDVGLSLQQLRDALSAMATGLGGCTASVSRVNVAGDLTEVFAAWRQLQPALTDPIFGLHIQTNQMVAALDDMMDNLRASIMAYEDSEAQSAGRLRAIGESAG